MSRLQFPLKTADETVLLSFDFTSRLLPGITISSQTVTAEVYSGTDPAPWGLLNGAPSASGQVISQSVFEGEEGVTYLLTATANTSDSQAVSLSGYLTVVPEGEQ